MSHWAELDQDNKVIRVLVGDNNQPDEGESFMNSLGGNWIKTSFNSTIRYNFAGIGYTYDPDAEAFIPPRPECGHTELFLNDLYKWNCQRCELNVAQL